MALRRADRCQGPPDRTWIEIKKELVQRYDQLERSSRRAQAAIGEAAGDGDSEPRTPVDAAGPVPSPNISVTDYNISQDVYAPLPPAIKEVSSPPACYFSLQSTCAHDVADYHSVPSSPSTSATPSLSPSSISPPPLPARRSLPAAHPPRRPVPPVPLSPPRRPIAACDFVPASSQAPHMTRQCLSSACSSGES